MGQKGMRNTPSIALGFHEIRCIPWGAPGAPWGHGVSHGTSKGNQGMTRVTTEVGLLGGNVW